MIAITGLAAIFGLALPLRWGVFGFAGAVALLFLGQFALNAGGGFEGTSWDETLLLFEGSWSAYIGFNLQVTARTFALPVLVLATLLIGRLSRAAA
ncbi:hypothetical protein [Phaeobacter sp.]|uniref:hypothetical protein n=1 Tax=Phaeobacter sp. TaxID=1902409 RepID=UPI0025EBE22A|nr:hypothetical protein [Phaeobacter sp.]